MLGKASLSNSRTGLRFAPTHTPQKLRDAPVPLFATEGTTCPALLSALSSSASPGNRPVGKGGGAQQPRGSVDRPSPPRTAQHGPLEPTAGNSSSSSSRIQIPRTELEETQGRSQPAASPWTGHGKAGGPGSRGSRPLPSPKYNLRRGLAAARLTSRNFGTLAGKVGQKFLRTAVAAEGSGGARSGGG